MAFYIPLQTQELFKYFKEIFEQWTAHLEEQFASEHLKGNRDGYLKKYFPQSKLETGLNNSLYKVY